MIDLLIKNKNIVIIILVILIIGYFSWNLVWTGTSKSDESPSKNVDENLQNVEQSLPSTSESKVKVYNFNTSWCRYSVMFSPEWAKFESMVENNPNIEAVDVKCDEEDNEQMCMNFDVPGYPSIVIVKDGERMDYPGQRNADDLLDYVSSL